MSLSKVSVENSLKPEKFVKISWVDKLLPNYFNNIAKDEYKRVIKGMRSPPVRNLDRAVLESYCTWYAVYKEISQKIDELGLVIYDNDKGWVANPLIITLEKATTNIRMTASQLGLTVDSRMKMFVPKQEKKEAKMKPARAYHNHNHKI